MTDLAFNLGSLYPFTPPSIYSLGCKNEAHSSYYESRKGVRKSPSVQKPCVVKCNVHYEGEEPKKDLSFVGSGRAWHVPEPLNHDM